MLCKVQKRKFYRPKFILLIKDLPEDIRHKGAIFIKHSHI